MEPLISINLATPLGRHGQNKSAKLDLRVEPWVICVCLCVCVCVCVHVFFFFWFSDVNLTYCTLLAFSLSMTLKQHNRHKQVDTVLCSWVFVLMTLQTSQIIICKKSAKLLRAEHWGVVCKI
jgi:hypothetical protein